MKKPNKETLNKIASPVAIFFWVIMGILLTIMFVNIFSGISVINNQDIYNWGTLVVEIGIGAGITLTVWKFSKRDQKTITRLITEVQNMEQKQLETEDNLLKIVEQQKRIITEQEETTKKRRRMVLHTIKNRIEGAIGVASLVCGRYDKMKKSDLDYNTSIIKYTMGDAVRLAELSVDVLDYDLVHSLSSLKSVIEGHHMSAFMQCGYDKDQFVNMAKLLHEEYLKYQSY